MDEARSPGGSAGLQTSLDGRRVRRGQERDVSVEGEGKDGRYVSSTPTRGMRGSGGSKWMRGRSWAGARYG